MQASPLGESGGEVLGCFQESCPSPGMPNPAPSLSRPCQLNEERNGSSWSAFGLEQDGHFEEDGSGVDQHFLMNPVSYDDVTYPVDAVNRTSVASAARHSNVLALATMAEQQMEAGILQEEASDRCSDSTPKRRTETFLEYSPAP